MNDSVRLDDVRNGDGRHAALHGCSQSSATDGLQFRFAVALLGELLQILGGDFSRNDVVGQNLDQCRLVFWLQQIANGPRRQFREGWTPIKPNDNAMRIVNMPFFIVGISLSNR